MNINMGLQGRMFADFGFGVSYFRDLISGFWERLLYSAFPVSGFGFAVC